jgi:uncharacterized delta-60 repeat protein
LGGWSNWSAVVSFSTVVNYGWAAKLSGPSTGSEWFNAVACDASGNIYAVGQETSSTGNNEAYITKWDSSGNLTWQRRIGGSGDDVATGVIVDASGNIYAVGYESTSTNSFNYEALITKWDASGNLTWQRKIGGNDNDIFYGVTVDSSGNIYAAGVDKSSAANNEAFITKWGASGNLTWQRRIGGSNSDYFYGITTDTSGNIYAVGNEISSNSNNNFEAFITKWDASGNLIWQRKIGGNQIDCFYGVACDSSGNIYAAGYEISSNGTNAEAFITKWDASGNLTWQKKIGGSNTDKFFGVTTDTSGNIYAVGSEYSSIGGQEAFITKWSSSGTCVWQKRFGGSSDDLFNGVACDTSGNIYAVGNESSTNSGNSYENCLITKWPSDITGQPTGPLAGTGMTSLSLNTAALTISTDTLTAATPTLTATTPTLAVATPTLTAATPTLTRYFSAF